MCYGYLEMKKVATDLDLIVEKMNGRVYDVDMCELYKNKPNARVDVLAFVKYYDNKPYFCLNREIKNLKEERMYVAMLISAIKLGKLVDNNMFILFANDDFKEEDEIIMMATEIMMPSSLFINLSNLYNDIELAEIFFVDIKWIKLKQKALLK